MDKKALLPGSGNYPQVPPQPETPLYRGFHPHKFLLNHADNTFFHEIWLYHHHHALDLYPDLEARLGPICPEWVLWTERISGTASTVAAAWMRFGIRPARSIATALRPQVPARSNMIRRQSLASTQSPVASSAWEAKRTQPGPSRKMLSVRNPCWKGFSPMIHVERKKKRPGASRASLCSTWNQADVRDAAA